MNLSLGSKSVGTRFAAIALSSAVCLFASTASAQEAGATPLFGNDVLDLLLESRNQKPASQATAEERAAAVDELTNIYLVSKLPRAA